MENDITQWPVTPMADTPPTPAQPVIEDSAAEDWPGRQFSAVASPEDVERALLATEQALAAVDLILLPYRLDWSDVAKERIAAKTMDYTTRIKTLQEERESLLKSGLTNPSGYGINQERAGRYIDLGTELGNVRREFAEFESQHRAPAPPTIPTYPQFIKTAIAEGKPAPAFEEYAKIAIPAGLPMPPPAEWLEGEIAAGRKEKPGFLETLVSQFVGSMKDQASTVLRDTAKGSIFGNAQLDWANHLTASAADDRFIASLNDGAKGSIGRGLGGAGGIALGNPAGKIGILTGGLRASAETKSAALSQGLSSSEADRQAAKTFPLMMSYLLASRLAGAGAARLAPVESSAVTKAAIATGGSLASNVAVSSSIAAFEGRDYGLENLTTDAFFALLNGRQAYNYARNFTTRDLPGTEVAGIVARVAREAEVHAQAASEATARAAATAAQQGKPAPPPQQPAPLGTLIDTATGRPVNSPADIEVFAAAGNHLAAMQAKDDTFLLDPERFAFDMRQVLHLGDPVGKVSIRTGPIVPAAQPPSLENPAGSAGEKPTLPGTPPASPALPSPAAIPKLPAPPTTPAPPAPPQRATPPSPKLTRSNTASAKPEELPKPLWSSNETHTIVKGKKTLRGRRYPNEESASFITKFYKPENYTELRGQNPIYLPMPSTGGKNPLARILAERLAEDFGGEMRTDWARPQASKEAKLKIDIADKLADPTRFELLDQAAGAVASGRPIVLVDDILTTGETAVAALDALHQAGARNVQLAVLAAANGGRRANLPDYQGLARKLQGSENLDEIMRDLRLVFPRAYAKLFTRANDSAKSNPTAVRQAIRNAARLRAAAD